MIRIGSWAIVIANMANGAPKASREQLKNSARVILPQFTVEFNTSSTKRCTNEAAANEQVAVVYCLGLLIRNESRIQNEITKVKQN